MNRRYVYFFATALVCLLAVVLIIFLVFLKGGADGSSPQNLKGSQINSTHYPPPLAPADNHKTNIGSKNNRTGSADISQVNPKKQKNLGTTTGNAEKINSTGTSPQTKTQSEPDKLPSESFSNSPEKALKVFSEIHQNCLGMETSKRLEFIKDRFADYSLFDTQSRGINITQRAFYSYFFPEDDFEEDLLELWVKRYRCIPKDQCSARVPCIAFLQGASVLLEMFCNRQSE